MSNTPLKAVRNVSFTTSVVKDPCVFVEVEQHQTGFAVGISGAASSLEIDQTGNIHVPGNLTVVGSIVGTVTPGTESANTIFAGPTTGSAALPTFRALVAADIPANTVTIAAINSKEGTGSKIQLTNASTTTSGDVVTYDGAGNVQDSGVLLSSLAVEVAAPLTASSTGTAGQIAYDATHIYVCVSTNVWVRATLATF